MKPEEKLFFETFIAVHPEFLSMKSWIPGPEPPDVIITDASARKLGIELTEWLDKRQTTPSISTTENEMKYLNPHFHFETLPPNLWIVAIINIHAGVAAMKTLWRSVPNG